MCKYKGEPVDGKKFFALLQADSGFCEQLGRAMLAAGRLESELKRYLSTNSVPDNTKRATLGHLLKLLAKYNLLKKMQPTLEIIRDQRNYLAHSIHALLSDMIEETILERSNLLDSDVVTYCERAWQLAENLNGFADIMEKEYFQSIQSMRAE
ncbi:MAG: hypothetical protein HY291_03925 [Planctomycetes bacterium]|nr:hypothetical protein [Planctomycetota bacterium]